MTTIPISQVNVSGRARTEYGNLDGLKDSLAAIGSIHPILVDRIVKDNVVTYPIIAGGRRFRAAKELGVTELHHGSVLEPGRIGYLYADEVPLDVLKEAELDENLWRLKPKWQEDCILIAQVHELKRDKIGHKWGQRQTAELLGPGYSLSKVSFAVRIAKTLRDNDEEIIACENMSDAIATLIKRQEEKALAMLQKRVLSQTSAIDLGSFLDTLNTGVSTTKPVETIEEIISGVAPPVKSATVQIPLSQMFQRGDFRTVLPSVPDGSFHHIVTDIPYGTDMKNLDTMKNISDVASEHDVEENVSLMEPFLTESFRLVRSGGFCVFFYDLDHHNYLQTLAKKIGWKVQRWPLIAYKTSPCQNNAAQYNFTKNYECAMVLRRDEQSVLRSQQASSIWMGDFATERRLYNNPFAKPFALWKWIFNSIAFPSQNILDPFCGEMSACRAAANCGLQPFGIELKENHYLRGLEHMKTVYAVIHGTNIEFK